MNRIGIIVLLLFSFLFAPSCTNDLPKSPSTKNLPKPYNQVTLLPFDPHGWFSNAGQLKRLIRKRHVKVIVEVGCWLGASTRFMAARLPEGGKLYAIYHWQGSVEHQPGGDSYHQALPYLYEQFLSNTIHAGLTDKIIPLRMDSLSAAKHLMTLSKPPILPDLIYIDAGHETASVLADLNAWYPFVKDRGVLCGDDWTWDSVQLAVETFAKENGLQIQTNGNFWAFIPKS